MLDQQRRSSLFHQVERATEMPMLVLAIIFLLAVVAPEVLELPPEWLAALDTLMWIVWALFAFELVVKTYLAPHRGRYLLTHWIDVLTVLVPFLRPLRLLPLLMVGVRFWTEARTVLRQRTFGVIGTASVLAVLAASVMVYLAERGGDGSIQSFPDALWWASVTITTVGYGDMYPKTPAGRGVAVLLMLIGISLFGLLTARVAAFFVESDREVAERLERIERHLLDRAAESENAALTGPEQRS